MEIVTRFDLGQKVIRVARQQHKASDPCAACDGRGKLVVERRDGTTQESYCDACRGRGVTNEVWYGLYEIVDESRVGQIEIRLRATPHFQSDSTREERYMIEATGVGSGSVYALNGEPGTQVWAHAELFATRVEAENFCAEKNPPILAELQASRDALRNKVLA